MQKTTNNMKIDKEMFLKRISTIFDQCQTIIVKKNGDYSKDSDPFSSFRGNEDLGITPPKALYHLMDIKMKRIKNLLTRENKVTSETINDSLNDLINYAAILRSYIEANEVNFRSIGVRVEGKSVDGGYVGKFVQDHE